ncbi:centromere/kinetochore protein zw10 [Bicyclus anynana]|uniref:Centromere/kinetochore protein zw10 n=1 Tax=Bicyclus anynana TaxID=110368 RepID=A0A6J1P1I0_BICAN|nr:centromere/kinetochore protein zw10 [Bicyclus anynana]
MSLANEVSQEADKATTNDLIKCRDELLPRLKDLTERVQMLSWSLHQNFIDTYFNFTPTKSLEQLNYKNRKSNILSDFTKFQEDVKFLDKKSEKKEVIEEFENNCKKLDKSLNSFHDLCTVVEGKIILDKANHEFGRYNYTEAMVSVNELKNKLRSMKFEGNGTKALANLNSQAESQLALYTAELSIEMEDIFTWSQKKGGNFLTYSLSVQQSDPSLLQKILKSLYVIERMNAELALFSHFFIDKLLHDIIQHNCEIFTEDYIGALVFNIKINLNETKKPNFQTIFMNLTAVFEFLQSTLGTQLVAEKTFIQVFADNIQDKFFNKIIEDCIRNNLPSCEGTYENYKNIVIELDSFNKFLIELKFVDTDKSPLNGYINDTECVLYNKKCDKLLSDVRNLLNESLSYGTIIVGTNLEMQNESLFDVTQKEVVYDLNNPLFMPRCVISQNVKRIMSMIVEHLEESIKLPQKYNNQLVMYIKDIAVMYQCIIPKKFKINLEHCPLDIALFFNNCFYLAHSLLGPPWRNSMPPPLAELLNTTLLECIQDLRVLGLEKISLFLQAQKNVIIQKIEANELPWSHDSYETLDRGINYAITLMQDLKNAWQAVLPARMYELTVCTLIQALCQSMLGRIFADTKPICEDLVYMIAVRFEDTIAEIATLFEEPMKFESKIDVWSKFEMMPKLLKAQMLEIVDLWSQHKGLSQSYACEEIRLIIKMRFPDDKYRLKILKEIQ